MAHSLNFYGIPFKADTQVAVEMEMVRRGGYYVDRKGVRHGLGLLEHFLNGWSLLWPEDDRHRWEVLILKNLLENRITVAMGSRDTSKTHSSSKWALFDYYCFPDTTLTVMTSTTMRGLERRVWGDIKNLHERAKKRYPWLPGNVVDAKHGIFTDAVATDGQIRDERKGISAIPCIGTNGEYLGSSLREFAGIKQKRRRLVGDELQYLPVEYLKVLDSFDKGDFKAAFLGNPIANNQSALDTVSEPRAGWGSEGTITKTTCWENKYGGVTINLVGTDSPNFDPDTLDKFPYLIDKGDADRVAARPGGKDSLEWWSQIMGIRKGGVVSNRVITVEEIERFGGFKECTWAGTDTIKLYSIDAGFGGDPCVRTYGEFGKDVDGRDILLVGEQVVIPILLSEGMPEQQIARYAKTDCDALRVPYSNVYFDAGMYATLAVEMARALSTEVNAVNCGGTATNRPVSADLFVWDEQKRERRLKTCYDHYSKLVTEFWFSVRLLVYGGQARHFPRLAAEDFAKREWRWVYGDRYELESKQEYKLRNQGQSPNYGDSMAILVEGARRLGFQIRNMLGVKEEGEGTEWIENALDKHRRYLRKTELKYA